jgi:hypothetical protein
MSRKRPLASKNFVALSATALFTLTACNAFGQELFSQNFIKQGDEVLTINLGGIFNQFETTLRLDGQGIRGTDIDLEANGLKENLSSFAAGGTWRFWSRNRIDVLYFSAKRTGGRTVDREVVIDDVVIPINASLSIQAKDQFLLADYRYSFVKTDALEFAGLLGFYGGQFEYEVSATRPLSGNQGDLLNRTTSTTVPLPLVGATLDWYINPRFKVSGNVSGVKAKIGDVDGHALIAGISSEFMLARNIGVGLGYLYSDIDVDVTKGDFNGNLVWKMNSVAAFLQVKF